MDALNARVISAAGTPDSVWLPWLAMQPVRRVSVAELCPGDARLVVVAPHPDDEVLACGGLLALQAERGMPSLVVAMTDGEASHGATDSLARSAMGARRIRESYAGLLALDVPPRAVIRLGLPDGQVASQLPAFVSRLRPMLRPSDVVLTSWKLDGHPDHEAAGNGLERLCAELGCRFLQAPVWMWHWARPDDSRVSWSSMVALDLPERTVQAKQHALRRHESQFEPREGGLGPVLLPTLVERAARRQEYFFP